MHTRSARVALSLAVIVLPILHRGVSAGSDQQPNDLPATATTAAIRLATVSARLATVEAHHEAALAAAWECAARVAAAQTALAPATPTPQGPTRVP